MTKLQTLKNGLNVKIHLPSKIFLTKFLWKRMNKMWHCGIFLERATPPSFFHNGFNSSSSKPKKTYKELQTLLRIPLLCKNWHGTKLLKPWLSKRNRFLSHLQKNTLMNGIMFGEIWNNVLCQKIFFWMTFGIIRTTSQIWCGSMVVGYFAASELGWLAKIDWILNSAPCQEILMENGQSSVCDLKFKRY